MLSKEDIKVGMRVNPRDLDSICYTLIILDDFKDGLGVIRYIGEPNTEESHRLYSTLHDICTVYNNDDEVADLDE